MPTVTFPLPVSSCARYRSETPEFLLSMRRDIPRAWRRVRTWPPIRSDSSISPGLASKGGTVTGTAPTPLQQALACLQEYLLAKE